MPDQFRNRRATQSIAKSLQLQSLLDLSSGSLSSCLFLALCVSLANSGHTLRKLSFSFGLSGKHFSSILCIFKCISKWIVIYSNLRGCRCCCCCCSEVVVVAGRHELRCLSIAYCPRIAQETRHSPRRRVATQVASSCGGGTKNTNQMQTHAAPKFTVTATTATTATSESTQSWCLADFYFYPAKLLMCTIFQRRRSASTFKWQKWRDNNNSNNCTITLRIA